MPLFDESIDVQNVVSVTSSAANPVYIAPSGGFAYVSQRPGSSNVTRVAVSSTSVQFLAANTARLGMIVVNESSGTMFLKYGTAAASNSYTYRITSNQVLEVGSNYTGIVHAILGSGSGNGQITELS
jgi:hypothetical protein